MDSEIKKVLDQELLRQNNNIELIASENFVSKEVLALQGSIFTNKYAEGYPHKRYYGGCSNADVIEELAIKYACLLFNSKFANVQPHSGSGANMAAYRALLNKGDKVMGMSLSDGGHLTHGHPVNFSGMDYEFVAYSVNSETEMLDYDDILQIALKEKPKMIVVGASAYSRIIDFEKFRSIADQVGAYLMVDMAHIAGLVATALHPSPIPYADVVTSTTHKTLRGPRGGLILTNNEEIIKKVNKTIFPGIQGGPLMHVIAAKAQAFYEALDVSFKTYQEQVLLNTKTLTKALQEEDIRIVSGGTDNHLILVDVKTNLGLTGLEAEDILDNIGITCNKNIIPNDSEKPIVTSGIRIGSPAMTTRGLKEHEFYQIGKIIAKALKNKDNEEILMELKKEVLGITSMFPIYQKD